MDWSHDGDFSKNLLSLQLQLQTLLEGVGGKNTSSLMDTLSKLSGTERDIIVPMLTRILDKLISENERVTSMQDAELKDFENALYESVLAAVNDAGRARTQNPSGKKKLELVSGGKQGKPIRFSALIDLNKAREQRRGKPGLRNPEA